MTTTTLIRPTKKAKPREATPLLKITKTERNDLSRVTKASADDDPEAKNGKKKKKKKEPMRKVGCWRGAFKGTPDF